METLFIPGPHGNAKKPQANSRAHVRTAPSIVKEIINQVAQVKPHKAYKRADHLNKGRNLKQYHNIKHVKYLII